MSRRIIIIITSRRIIMSRLDSLVRMAPHTLLGGLPLARAHGKEYLLPEERGQGKGLYVAEIESKQSGSPDACFLHSSLFLMAGQCLSLRQRCTVCKHTGKQGNKLIQALQGWGGGAGFYSAPRGPDHLTGCFIHFPSYTSWSRSSTCVCNLTLSCPTWLRSSTGACNLIFMLHHLVEVIQLCVSSTFHPAPRGCAHLLVYVI